MKKYFSFIVGVITGICLKETLLWFTSTMYAGYENLYIAVGMLLYTIGLGILGIALATPTSSQAGV